MAKTLAQIVKANAPALVKGPGGVLTQPTEDLQELAGKAGLQAPPTTPLGAAMLGATPDQQKMAGTPAQMQSAIRLSTEGTDVLAEAQRRRQTRMEMTGAEQAKAKRAESLAGLTSAEKKTQELINSFMPKAAEPGPAITAEQKIAKTIPTTLPGITEAQFTAGRLLLVQAQEAIDKGLEIDSNILAQLNTAFGRTAENPLTANDVKQLLSNSIDVVAQKGTEAVRNELTVQDLVADGRLGYTSEQLAKLLNVSEDVLKQTKVGDFEALINQVQAEAFSTAEQLRQQAASGLIGQAERAGARQQLRDVSATGVAAVEADVQRIEDAVARADVVTFNGKQYTVGDLLKDENISQFIKDYLNADEATKKKIEAAEPEFTGWIKNHVAGLSAATEKLGKGVQTFAETQAANVAFAKNFPPALLTAIGIDPKKISATSLKDIDNPVIKKFNSITDDKQKQNFLANIKVLSDAGLADQVAKLSAEDLEAFNLTNADPAKVKQYLNAVNTDKAIKEYEVDDVDQIVAALAGGDASVTRQSIQTALDSNVAIRGLGLPVGDLSIFDSNNDGIVDDGATLLSKLKGSIAVPSLAEFIKGKQPTLPQFSSAATAVTTEPAAAILSTFKDELKDGKLTTDEILSKRGIDLTTIGTWMTSPDWQTLGVEARTAISNAADNIKARNFTTDLVKTLGAIGSNYASLVERPDFLDQIGNPDLYRDRLAGAPWNVIAENADMYSNMLAAVDRLLKDQSKLPFQTVDMAQLQRTRDSLQAMVYMTWDEAGRLSTKEKDQLAAAAAQAPAPTPAPSTPTERGGSMRVTDETLVSRPAADDETLAAIVTGGLINPVNVPGTKKAIKAGGKKLNVPIQ